MANTYLNSDIYDISDFVNQIKQDYTEGVSEETLQLGIYGYMGEMFSTLLQNGIVMASEFANESIPTKAKFEKNVIAHALGLNYDKINAVPATLDVFLTFRLKELTSYMDSHYTNTFFLDRDNAFYVGDYEFHMDYDMRIKRITHLNSVTNYTATYMMPAISGILIDGFAPVENPVSDITNPYIVSPAIINLAGEEVMFVKCTLRQCTRSTVETEILQDNTIASKSTSFSFDDQLAGFDIDVEANDEYTHMIPVYEGLYTDGTDPYFYYTYLDSSTIRIKFTTDSYQPRVNAKVKVNVITTKGAEGNFTWSGEDYPYRVVSSEKLFQSVNDNGDVKKTLQSSYSNITIELRPLTGISENGTDKKSIAELKKIIPREALARGSITNVADLENYFNSIDSESSRMYIYKRRDNCMERLYYGYMLMKNGIGNIIPTNTLDVEIKPSELQTDSDSIKQILRYNTRLDYTTGDDYAVVYHGTDVDDLDANEYINLKSSALWALYLYLQECLESGEVYCDDYISKSSIAFHRDEDDNIYFEVSSVVDKPDYRTITNVYRDWILELIDLAYVYFNRTDEKGILVTKDTGSVYIGEEGVYEIPLGENIRSTLYSEFKGYMFTVGYSSGSPLRELIENEVYLPVTIIGTKTSGTTYNLILHFNFFESEEDLPTSDTDDLALVINMIKDAECPLYTDTILSKNTEIIDSAVKITGPYTVTLAANLVIGEESEEEEDSDSGIALTMLVEDDTTHLYESSEGEALTFNYIIPYNTVVNTSPLYIMYYLPYMNVTKELNFDYVNENAEYQFIATYLSWYRRCLPEYDEDEIEIITDINTYFCDIAMEINVSGANLITTDSDGNITDSRVRVFMIFMKEREAYRWLEGTINSYDSGSETFNVHFEFSAVDPNGNVDNISTDNEIKIYGVNRLGLSDADDSSFGYGFFDSNTEVYIYAACYQDGDVVDDLDEIIDSDILESTTEVADTEDKTVTYNYNLIISNRYEVVGGIDWFYDFSDIAYSTVTVEKDENDVVQAYHLQNVPLLKKDYFTTEDRAQEFIQELISRKEYIDNAIEVIEDSFGIDFKFVNTYGPCKMVTLDNKYQYLNRVNLSVTFRLKYNANYDFGIMDDLVDAIKTYIEDINTIDSVHMSNLCTYVMNLYSESLEFFEFVDMNGYGAEAQHMYAMEQEEAIETPEFVNIQTLSDDTPDITILVVS